MVKLNYTQFINIEKVNLEIIEYFLNKNIQIQFFAESTEKVQKLGKLEPPMLKTEKKLFKHDYLENNTSRRRSSFVNLDPKE